MEKEINLFDQIKGFADQRDNDTLKRIEELKKLINEEINKYVAKNDRMDYLCKLVEECWKNKIYINKDYVNSFYENSRNDEKLGFRVINAFADKYPLYVRTKIVENTYLLGAKEVKCRNYVVFIFDRNTQYAIVDNKLKKVDLYYNSGNYLGKVYLMVDARQEFIDADNDYFNRFIDKKEEYLKGQYNNICKMNDEFDRFETNIINEIKRLIGQL